MPDIQEDNTSFYCHAGMIRLCSVLMITLFHSLLHTFILTAMGHALSPRRMSEQLL
jgi:hypothetical protein